MPSSRRRRCSFPPSRACITCTRCAPPRRVFISDYIAERQDAAPAASAERARTFRHVCCSVRGSSFGFNIMKPAVPLPRGALIFRSRPRYIGETRDEIGKNRITVHARRRGNRRMGCGALWSACRPGRII